MNKDRIGLPAQVIALSDSLYAMTTKKSYREISDPEAAFKGIGEGAVIFE